jgi:hypothetical protein
MAPEHTSHACGTRDGYAPLQGAFMERALGAELTHHFGDPARTHTPEDDGGGLREGERRTIGEAPRT